LCETKKMKREQSRHGFQCKTTKTIKCCPKCLSNVMKDSTKGCYHFVDEPRVHYSLNKHKNWEMLEQVEKKPTNRVNIVGNVNKEKSILLATPIYPLKMEEGIKIVFEVPQNPKSVFQQRKLCCRAEPNQRNKIKHKENFKNIDFSLF
jgi:hypothetical protein